MGAERARRALGGAIGRGAGHPAAGAVPAACGTAELRKAGMVKTRRESRSIFYSIADARAEAILEMLRVIFCDDVPRVAKAQITAAQPAPLRQKAGDTAQFARME
jgi:DNA-binding transcriptional ArsR family regulator